MINATVMHEREQPLEALLCQLRDWAARPFENACAMTPGVYLSEDFLTLERERIFRKEWLCVGRAESIPNPGDYIAYDILDQPIFVVRDGDREIRALSNVCLHRMSKLLDGCGTAKRIVCPYHAWTYALDGRLTHAPHMEKSSAFSKEDYCLPRVRCEVWQGWIYVTLGDESLQSVSKRLQPLGEAVVDRYRMVDYVETFREEHIWRTNWKVLAENFMESYHLFKLHRATVGPHSRLQDMECPPGGDTFNYHWITKESSLLIGNAHPDNRHLNGDWRHTTALITIYPSHLITLTPGYFWYLVLQPRGVDKVNIAYGGGMAPEYIDDQKSSQYLGELKTLLDKVNSEDQVGVENVYRGLKSDFATGGHLCYLERPNYEFGQYLARQVVM